MAQLKNLWNKTILDLYSFVRPNVVNRLIHKSTRRRHFRIYDFIRFVARVVSCCERPFLIKTGIEIKH